MSWSDHHLESERYASEAHTAFKDGRIDEARKLYKFAADSEVQALAEISPEKTRTLGITTVSAAALYYKGQVYETAEKLAYKYLAREDLPAFAAQQLQEILISVWNEKTLEKSGVSFAEGTVLVSIKGGMVVYGGAPLDLIHRKVDEVKNTFYRVVEMLLDRPFRRKGSPDPEIQQQFRPWLFQAAPSSYQFAVRVQKPPQLPLFPENMPQINELVNKFFQILEATAKESHENFKEIVPDDDYRESFLKLTRNLAPTGKSFERLEIKSATDPEALPVYFVPESRKSINKTLRKGKKRTETEREYREEHLYGILRGLHLDRDWIEIHIPERGPDPVRIYQAGDIIDDIVGPMVNQSVIVDVLVKPDGKYIFRDIQSEE